MMENLKRWWWVVAIVVVAGGLVLYSAFGRGGSSVSSSGAGSPGASPTTQSPASKAASSPATGSASLATAPVPVAPKGSKLTTVTAIPKDTLARIKFSKARNNQTYNIRFRVYGTGPSIAGHAGIVILIESSSPQKASSSAFKFRSMNALVQVAPKVKVTKGGAYTGVMKLVSQSGGLVPVLTQAKAL